MKNVRKDLMTYKQDLRFLIQMAKEIYIYKREKKINVSEVVREQIDKGKSDKTKKKQVMWGKN